MTEMEEALQQPVESKVLNELMSKLLSLTVADAVKIPKHSGFSYHGWNQMFGELVDTVLAVKAGEMELSKEGCAVVL